MMRESLLWALYSLTGYSTALSTPHSSPDASSSTSPPLTFTRDGTFKISIFEDLHFGEAEDLDWGPRQDEISLKVMRRVLDIEGPQLVVLNGDLITGENTMLSNATDYIDMIVQPLVEGGYRWASAYGNHDQAYNLSAEAMLAKERSYGSASLTDSLVKGDGVGVTNYNVPIFGKAGDAVPVLILWFFDSQGGREFQQHDHKDGKEVVVPGVVHEQVVKWFQQTSTSLNAKYGNPIPSLGFVHIPVSAMLAFQKGGVDEHNEPGLNSDVPLGSQGPDDTAFVQALTEKDGMLAVFSGHDHGNDFCNPSRTSQTPFFCFGRHTGYGGYGHWMRGSRQVVVNRRTLSNAEPDIETWIRLEDGTVSGHVFLNETYGVDVYPVVDDKKTKLPPADP
jgi:Calcineurin-like phosphoesterase